MSIDNSLYQLKFKSYQRPFRRPLHTSHGIWRVREGIIIEITDSLNQIGKGEIAPIPWFGSETLEEALQFCQQLGNLVTKENIKNIPDRLPACQFAFESALTNSLEHNFLDESKYSSLSHAYLLPAGESVLTAWQTKTSQNNLNAQITFKWKIGVDSLKEEIRIAQKLLELLPPHAKLRLDANGGLDIRQAKHWLELAEQTNKIEFIEQPLPPQQFTEMLALSQDYSKAKAVE